MFKNFALKLVLLTVTLALIIWILQTREFFAGYQSFVWISLVFLSFVTVGTYVIMDRALEMKGHTYFMIAFAAGFGIKSLASLMFLSYFIFFQPIVNKFFILPFFFMYFIYTGLMVSSSWQASRKKPLP
jgi:hypothetical protein